MFEWNQWKNALNIKKHGISFEEASEIFNSPVFTVEDTREDYGEIRSISIGILDLSIILVVVHTDRDGTTRLISARKASKNERKIYYGYIKKTLKGD